MENNDSKQWVLDGFTDELEKHEFGSYKIKAIPDGDKPVTVRHSTGMIIGNINKHCIAGIYEIVEELNTILNKALNDEDGIEELAQYLLIFYLVFVNDRPGYDEVKLAAEKIKAARNIAKAIIQHDIVNPYCDEIFLKVLKLIDAFIKVGIYESIITSSDLRIMFQKSNWTDCDWLD